MTVKNIGTRKEDTSYRDISYSQFHRKCGRKNLGSDVDFIEYMYVNGEKKVFAVSDTKCVLDDQKNLMPIDMNRDSIDLNRMVADKFEVPFFVIVTYLTENYKAPMVYVIGGNLRGHKFLHKCPKDAQGGVWMTPRNHCRMLYALRGEEPEKDILESLPNEKAVYNLPEIIL